jgi:hypothetical protein
MRREQCIVVSRIQRISPAEDLSLLYSIINLESLLFKLDIMLVLLRSPNSQLLLPMSLLSEPVVLQTGNTTLATTRADCKELH